MKKGLNELNNTVTHLLKVKATINATKEQLLEIGCNRNLMGLELDVSHVDYYTGIYSPCSLVYYVFKLTEEWQFNETYVIPSRWLKFK